MALPKSYQHFIDTIMSSGNIIDKMIYQSPIQAGKSITGNMYGNTATKIIIDDLFDEENINQNSINWDGTQEGAVKAKIWMTNDGRVLDIHDMETSHITNTIHWILRNRDLDDPYYIGQLKNLREALAYRQQNLNGKSEIEYHYDEVFSKSLTHEVKKD